MRSAGRLGLASLPSLAQVEHQGKEEVAEESEEYWGGDCAEETLMRRPCSEGEGNYKVAGAGERHRPKPQLPAPTGLPCPGVLP